MVMAFRRRLIAGAACLTALATLGMGLGAAPVALAEDGDTPPQTRSVPTQGNRPGSQGGNLAANQFWQYWDGDGGGLSDNGSSIVEDVTGTISAK